MARHADKYALVRSVWHDAPPLHDAGHQIMQTGRLFEDGEEHPHFGAVLSKLTGSRKRHAARPDREHRRRYATWTIGGLSGR